MENETREKEDNVFIEDNEKEDNIEKLFSENEENRKSINYYRIINNHGVYTGDGAFIENLQLGKKREYRKKEKAVFSDVRSLNDWMNENYGTYDMAIMIAIMVFEGLPYDKIVRTAEVLFDIIPQNENIENKRSGLTEIMECLGAERCPAKISTYAGAINVEVILLNEKTDRETLLKNVWTEYPNIHDVIVNWLKEIYIQERGIVSQRSVESMVWIASYDMYYFLHQMINIVDREKKCNIDIVFGHIILMLITKETYAENMFELLKKWSKRNHVHQLLTCIFACVKRNECFEIMERAICRYIYNLFEELKGGHKRGFLKNIYSFYAAGLRSFSFYRILIGQLYKIAQDTADREEKSLIAKLFLWFAAIDINITHFEKEDAILFLLCFRDFAEREKLYFLWENAWNDKKYRQKFYEVTAQYECERILEGNESNMLEFVKRILGKEHSYEVLKDVHEKIQRRTING